MSSLNLLVQIIKVSLAATSLVTCFFTIIDFTWFLSVPNLTNKTLHANQDIWLKASWDLFINMSLVSAFILQHSLLAIKHVKEFVGKYELQDIYRSLYVISTALVLSCLVNNWHASEIVFWKLNLNYKPVWWIYVSVHSLAWMLIYIGNLCTDVTELIGIKQVYYSIVHMPDPSVRKSMQLQRLNSHMRHPSFLAFVLIFWLCPIMSIDRLILSSVLTIYMYLAWNTDERDYDYQEYQYNRKYHELERLQRSTG